MPDTGYNWDAAWTAIEAAKVLTQGGTTEYSCAEISLDGKAACEVSIDADYSNHAKATGGLFIWILRDIDETVFEAEADLPWGFEMPFTQAGTNRRTFSINAGQVSKFVIFLDWDNSTGSAAVTVAVAVRYATVPAAS